MSNSWTAKTCSRRHALGLGIALAASALRLPALAALPENQRRISFNHLHTKEQLSLVYWRDGYYLADALRDIDYLLRDHRTGEVKRVDYHLLDLLYLLRRQVDSAEPYDVFSAYRSPETNELLARRRKGVARRSLHMRGMAVDVDLPDRRLSVLRKTAQMLRVGGVGYYPKSGFLHLDVGGVRFW